MKGKSDTVPALKLSLLPAFFAAGCCAIVPTMVIFGFAMGEAAFAQYRWWFMALGVIVLIVSLVLYFRKEGIRTQVDLVREKKKVVFVSAYTVLLTGLIYVAMIYFVTPYLYEQIGRECFECSIFNK